MDLIEIEKMIAEATVKLEAEIVLHRNANADLDAENARLREELDCTKDMLEQTRAELAILRAASAVYKSRGGV